MIFAQCVYSNKAFLIGLFLFSLLVRVLLFINFTRDGTNAWIYVDSEQYNTIALNIADGKGISMEPNVAQYYRLPGYPLFLAACYKLFDTNHNVALLIQIVFASFIPLIVFFLSLALFPQNIVLAQLAGIIASMHLGFLLYAGMLATETLTILLLLLFFILFFSGRHIFLAGLLLGLASLVRPIGHYVLVVALITRLLSGVEIGQKIKQAILLVLGFLVVITPWLIRNFLLTGYIFFHSLPGLHFVQYTAANIVMQHEGSSYPHARARVLNEWNAMVADQEFKQERLLNEYERCLLGETLTGLYIKKYPGYAMKHMALEIFKTCAGLYAAIILLADGAVWPDYGPMVTWQQKVERFLFPAVKRPFLAVLIYSEIIMLLLMIIGFGLFLISCCYDVVAFRSLCLFLPYVILFIGLTLAYGGARLRMPADPFLIIAAAYGCLSLWNFLLQREKHLRGRF